MLNQLAPRFVLAGISLLGTFALTGCDDRPAIPPAPTTQATAVDHAPKPPTTQEIVSGARKDLVLTQIPLRVKAPPGWRCETDNLSTRFNYLRGPTPSGNDIQIRLSSRPRVDTDKLPFMVAAAKKEQKNLPKQIPVTEFRETQAMSILETHRIGPPKPPVTAEGEGAAISDTSPDYSWTLNIFVPSGKDFAQYELDFYNLTQKQYDADKDFIRSILDTLTLTAGAQ